MKCDLTRLKIYLDMDGVIADFEKRFIEHAGKPSIQCTRVELWGTVVSIPGFWANLEWTPGGEHLWALLADHHYLCILSACGSHDTARATVEKNEWLDAKIGRCNRIFKTQSVEKHHLAGPHCLLIDDYKRNTDAWVKAGGIAILHKTFEKTLAQLKALGVL